MQPKTLLMAVLLLIEVIGPTKAQDTSSLPTAHSFNLPANSILTQVIPGYKLQVLEKTKPIALTINGATVNTTLPVFIYMPESKTGDGVLIIKGAINDFENLTKKPSWSEEELAVLLTNLKHGLALLDQKL